MNFHAAMKTNNGNALLTSGFKKLDESVGGLVPGSLAIIGSYTSRGKSLLALQWALRTAGLQPEKTVIFFSNESSHEEITLRALAAKCLIPHHELVRKVPLTAERRQAVARGAAAMEHLPLVLVDRVDYTRDVALISDYCQRKAQEQPLSLVVVDCFESLNFKNMQGLTQEFNLVAKTLKNIAETLNTCVITTLQLGNSYIRRTGVDAGNSPRLDDLNCYAAIENSVDTVVLLHHPHDFDQNKPQENVTLQLRLHRGNAAHVDVDLHWEADFVRFDDMQAQHNVFATARSAASA